MNTKRRFEILRTYVVDFPDTNWLALTEWILEKRNMGFDSLSAREQLYLRWVFTFEA